MLFRSMYNIRANWPDGFLLWLIGSLALAYAADIFLLYVLAMFAGVVALVGHPFAIFGSFGHSAFLLTSSVLLFVATIVSFLAGLHIQKKGRDMYSDM